MSAAAADTEKTIKEIHDAITNAVAWKPNACWLCFGETRVLLAEIACYSIQHQKWDGRIWLEFVITLRAGTRLSYQVPLGIDFSVDSLFKYPP